MERALRMGKEGLPPDVVGKTEGVGNGCLYLFSLGGAPPEYL